jgi:hypothetical protein
MSGQCRTPYPSGQSWQVRTSNLVASARFVIFQFYRAKLVWRNLGLDMNIKEGVSNGQLHWSFLLFMSRTPNVVIGSGRGDNKRNNRCNLLVFVVGAKANHA